MSDERAEIAIVGAGAAGLMAAIAAGRSAPRSRILLLDGATRIGAKILIAGGGRCNVTHHEVRADDFNGGSRNAIAKVLRSFPVSETIAFFREIGVDLKREETGKLFPVDDRARTVLDALTAAARAAGAELIESARVERVTRTGTGFTVETSRGTLHASRVILATGGRSVPKSGSDGHGFEIARALGHRVTPLFPALVPLVLPSGHWMTALKGISCGVELRVIESSGRRVAAVRGSMLFTHFGVSGPAVLDISRHWISACAGGEASLEVSFVPGTAPEELDAALIRDAGENPHGSVGNRLRRWIPERLADAVAESAGVAPAVAVGKLTRESRRALVRALTASPLSAIRDRGWDFAEVTAGGVPLSELDLATMESRITPALHLCGEICDVDGRIGGFNFQWAWASGKVAGEGAGRKAERRTQNAELRT